MSKRGRRKKTRKKQKGGGWTPALKTAIEIADDVRQTKSEVAAALSEAAAMTTEIPALSMEEAAAKVTTANRLMKQPWAKTLPGPGCMPLAMGGMPESPYPLPPIPCPRSGIPSWLEALGVAGPDPIAMIPMPPFVGGVIAAEDLRGDIEEKITKFEASNKLAAKAKAMGIPIPPNVEGPDWETKTATGEAYRLLKPGQILLDWDTEELDKKLANVGVKPSIPLPKPKPKPAAAPSMSGEEVSEAEIAKLNEGTGKKMVVFQKGFTWKGGGRKSRKKKHRRKKTRRKQRGGQWWKMFKGAVADLRLLRKQRKEVGDGKCAPVTWALMCCKKIGTINRFLINLFGPKYQTVIDNKPYPRHAAPYDTIQEKGLFYGFQYILKSCVNDTWPPHTAAALATRAGRRDRDDFDKRLKREISEGFKLERPEVLKRMQSIGRAQTARLRDRTPYQDIDGPPPPSPPPSPPPETSGGRKSRKKRRKKRRKQRRTRKKRMRF